MLYHVIPCYTMLYHVIPCYTMFWVRKSTGVLSSWACFFHHPSGVDLQKQLGMNETRKPGTLEKYDEIEAGITSDHHRHDQNVWPDGCPEIWRWHACYPLKNGTFFYTHMCLSYPFLRSDALEFCQGPTLYHAFFSHVVVCFDVDALVQPGGVIPCPDSSTGVPGQGKD